MTNQNQTTSGEPLTPAERRAQTARQNGAKSRGPVTPEGKARAGQNALKHGLSDRSAYPHETLRSAKAAGRHGFLARTVVLPNESHKRFTRLLKTIQKELLPTNDLENYLVECMAVARWRRLRAWGLERAIIGYEAKTRTPAFTDIASSEHSIQTARTLRHFSDDSRFLDNLSRHEVRYDRQHDRALQRLLNLRARNRMPVEPTL